jgi:hypothetical protein
VGELVAVALAVRNPQEFTGRLEEVNDRGVVLTIAPARPGASEAFYPWGAVRRLRLASGRDDASSRSDPETGGRLPGDPGWFS